MSGPVSTADVPAARVESRVASAFVEVSESRSATVGGVQVRRALPKRQRRTVGAWCFVDHLGPATLDERTQVEIGPHPHIGLQTVTWLLQGEQLHLDSLGSEQLIRPGELNLMTAGHGVVHAEESRDYRGAIHGVQLWVAQPDATRDASPAFEHHDELPLVELDAAVATVLLGEFSGAVSPARRDTPLVGLDLAARRGASVLPLSPDFEYALIVLDGALTVGSTVVRPGALAYLGEGRDELPLAATEATRALLLGGVPFGSPVFMWWNFVARSREEIAVAYEEWQSGAARFADVASPLPRIPAPAPSWPPGR
ncbi:MAG: pirin family protein [Actinomycetota bacterium]|nr:pirin family protein [Actinomycetota bacterium]